VNPYIVVAQVDSLDFVTETSADLDAYLTPRRYPVPRAALNAAGWSLAADTRAALLDKLRAAGVPLGAYVDGAIYRGITSGYNEAFVINAKMRAELIAQDPNSADVIKPWLRGRDIKRLHVEESKLFFLYIPWGFELSKYPAISEHLESYREKLSSRPEVKQGRFEWYALSRYGSGYVQCFDKPKIVYSELAARSQFSIDTKNYYLDSTGYIIGSDSPYLLAVLNSSVFNFMFRQVSSQVRGGYLRWKRQYMIDLPIPRPDLSDPVQKARHDKLVDQVGRLLALHRQAADAGMSPDVRAALGEQIAGLDAAIDMGVCALYGLTDAEIALLR
jgi:hypothetical protein